MLILAMDTAGRQGNVALLRAHDYGLETLDSSSLPGGRYSEALVPAIAEMLTRHGFDKASVELIAVASGPGSFTGLRVAIATVKGLAEAFGTPVVAVSVLEAISLASGAQGKVLAALDAQRNEVFYAEYDISSSLPVLIDREAISKISDFVAHRPAGNSSEQVFTPDEALAARLKEAGVATGLIARPSPEIFARIAYRKFQAGERSDISLLDANYVRRSDAEIISAPKLGIVPR